jgi:hypothetical protein
MLTKDEAQKNSRRGQPAHIDDWGGEVRIRSLSISELEELSGDEKGKNVDKLESGEQSPAENPDGYKVMLDTVSKAITEPKFTPGELRDIGSDGVIQAFQIIQERSGGARHAEAKGNS